MLSEIIFGLIATVMAIFFFAVPVVKLAPSLGLKVIPLVIVVLIGVAMMVWEFVETVRASRNDKSR
jgi:hypothetical protein